MRKITLETITRKLYSIVYYIINQHQYAHLSKTSHIYKPLKIQGKKNIHIHSNTTIGYKAWLEAGAQTGHTPYIEVHQGATIGNFNHIYATKSIIIEKNVLTADRVYISDNLHSFENVKIPILKQPIKQISEVVIGEGSWLGEGVCVIGAKIGKGCVIGANAVVTKDIPDYCIAVGIPAKIIKQYNPESEKWELAK